MRDSIQSEEDLYFEKVVMEIQEVILDEEFQSKQNDFMTKNSLCGKDEASVSQIFA